MRHLKLQTLAVNAKLPSIPIECRNGQIKATGVRQWSRAKDPTTGAERPISALDQLEYSVGVYQDLPRLRTSWSASLRTPCAKSSTIKGCTETVYRFDEIDAYRATPAVNLYVETHVSKGWLLHLDTVLRQRFTRVISTYAGPRNEYPLIKIDARSIVQPQPAARLLLLRNLQPFAAPDALDRSLPTGQPAFCSSMVIRR